VVFAEIQFFDPGFDFRAVADNHPGQIVRMDHGSCGVLEVAHLQCADFAGVGFIVIVGQAKSHQVEDRLTHFALRFARAGEGQRLVGLNFR
jgi:hypothetical protein